MKRLTVIILVLSSLISFSQNFVMSNKQWNVVIEAWGPGGISSNTEIFLTSGDTTINEQLYSKLYLSYDSLQTSYYRGALREDNNQVFFINIDGAEGLLYDFNLNVGDSTYIVTDFTYGGEELLVIIDSVNYVEINEVQYKIFWIHEDYMTGMTDYWIEGIGSNNGPLYTLIHHHIICPLWQLSCCYEDGVSVFNNENLDCYMTTVGIDEFDKDKISFHPNPVNKGRKLHIQVSENDQIYSVELFDLMGNKVFEQLEILNVPIELELDDIPRGMYVFVVHTNNSKEFVRKILLN